ncbi:MAG: hypothetical protein ABL867_00550 [Rickettsiales bacterium]
MSEQMSQQMHEDDSETLNFTGVLQAIETKREFNTYAKGEQVIYEFTEDPGLLHQYYRLREDRYRRVFNLRGFDGGEDKYDRLSHILVARRGRLCLGGCRLTIREGDETWSLPTEVDEYIFRDLFPDWGLDKVRHAEISRFVVMEDSGEEDVTFGLCKAMYSKVTSSNIHYLFVSSTYSMARNWRMISNSFGVRTTKIVNGIHPPDRVLGEDIKWYLTVSDLSGFCHNGYWEKGGKDIIFSNNYELLN